MNIASQIRNQYTSFSEKVGSYLLNTRTSVAIKPHRISDNLTIGVDRGCLLCKSDCLLCKIEPIAFINVPYGGKYKKLLIIVDGEMRLDNKSGDLLSYCIRATYFIHDTSSSSWNLLNSFHFDMDPDRKPGHPRFHAQIGRQVDPGDIKNISEKFRQKISDFDQKKNIRVVRIPTPQYDLAAVVLMIISDNLPKGKHYDALLGEIRSPNAPFFPKSATDANIVIDSVNEHQSLKSVHWYF